MVGAGGFAVDWLFLQLFVRGLGLGPLIGRVGSVLIALTATWVLHRWFTFCVVESATFSEWLKYVFANVFGAAVNYLVYAVCLRLMPPVGLTIPLAIASVAALIVNYLGASLFVFKKRAP